MNILKRTLFCELSLLLLLLSSFTALPDRIMGRNAFFLSIILMLLASVKNIKNLQNNLSDKILSLTILLYGISQWVWCYFYSRKDNIIFLANQNYNTISHYLIFIGISLFFINSIKPISYSHRLKTIVIIFSTVGFFYMCGVGIFYFLNHPGERIRIDSAATITAYIVTLQCLFTIYLLDVLKAKFKKTLILLVVATGFITLVHTETRAAILCFPILLFLYFFTSGTDARKKTAIYFIPMIIMLFFSIKLFFPLTLERLNSSYTEISEINVNNDSSIGARVSMWQSGIYAFTKHPLGQSASSRFKEVISYIDSKESGNPEAKRNSVYHLHNDLIEKLSLQGIVGGITYILLLAAILYSAIKRNMLREYFLLFLLPIILYGSVDTLFIDKRFIIVFGAQLLLLQIFQRKNIKE